MIIRTKYFDEVDIDESTIITFSEGVPSFEDQKRFVLLDFLDNLPFKCLQSIDRFEVSFILVNPWDFFEDYNINIDDSELEIFNDKDMKNYLVYNIVNFRNDSITANLLAPVLINIKSMQGKQFILYKSGYTTKHVLKPIEKKV